MLLDCMSKLASRHPQTKFLKIISTDCIPDLPDTNLPTVLVYFDKKCQKTYAGLNAWGGKRASEECAFFPTLQYPCQAEKYFARVFPDHYRVPLSLFRVGLA